MKRTNCSTRSAPGIGAAYSAALADFIVQVENTSQLFVTGPALADEVLGESVTPEALGGSNLHRRSGVTHLVAPDDRACIALIRRLLAYLAQNNRERPAAIEAGDPADRPVPELLDIVPIDSDANYDMHEVVGAIVDGGKFFEIQEGSLRATSPSASPGWADSRFPGAARRTRA